MKKPEQPKPDRAAYELSGNCIYTELHVTMYGKNFYRACGGKNCMNRVVRKNVTK